MTSSISDRLIQMFRGIGKYLFPALLFLAVAYIVYRKKEKNGGIELDFLCILAGAVLSYGAMILSPHYPDRAAYGTCILIEICAAALINRSLQDKSKTTAAVVSFTALVPAIVILCEIIIV